MAFTVSFLSFVNSSTSLFWHWALVVILCLLLSTNNFLVNADPTLVLHGLPNNLPAFSYTPSNAETPIKIAPLSNVSYNSNPLVTIALKNASRLQLFVIFSLNTTDFIVI